MNPFLKTIGLAAVTICLTILLIYFPDEALAASLRGLKMWGEVVFPSLLPFFITAELLLAFGVVKFLGVLFEPIMRPLFNVPGAGSFGWMMGMASGYPTGAKIAARLREEKQLTQIEAERLVSFTNNSSPLFIFGAISVGLFHNAALGLLLAAVHYGSNMIVGVFMRFYKIREEKSVEYQAKTKNGSILIQALKQMHATRSKDPRPLGEILGDAVLQSIKTLVMVGGFIILFSVIVQLLHLVHFTVLFSKLFEGIFFLLGIPISLGVPFFSGLFEITLGATLISDISTDSLLPKVILVSFILGFNGFSIQAQVASILAKTDIRFFPYFFARVLHGIIASILTVILYKPLYLNHGITGSELPVATQPTDSFFANAFQQLTSIGPFVTIIFLWLGFLLFYKAKKTGS
ncbi:sporulation integral membrane protein YlbJ [Oceanobacillus alkalisoli]|uniref:sporulation integral membrane protein YlbJ n=1 Tax=Oceanobacillus alkalisoli TaxID=2925113 RepID=UPI001F11BE35|nr:sporulation integral membrane protein YlbJ [Oceanobacillus alkalisoli]MCF3942536.1 sporulation integral membrane protein YlbJ [Oceanobacillus alkalisoli]